MAISSLTINKTYQDGSTLTEAQLDAGFGSVETWSSSVATKAADKTGTDTITGTWTYAVGTLKLAGAGAGVATLAYANSGSSRTLTFPADADDTVATLTATQTLTNKTISSPTVTGTFTGAHTLLSPLIGMIDKGASGAGTITCDCATGSKFRIQATGNFTLAFSNFTDGQRVEVWIVQDGTGSRTVTWPAATRWLNGTGATNSTTDAPTLTTTANKFDVIFFEKFDFIGTDGNIYGFMKGFKGAIT